MRPERNDRIKKAIKKKRITQQELAEYIGVRQATINAQINGDREIDSLRTIDAVVALTGCNREWLMYGVGPQENDLQEPLAVYNTSGSGDSVPIMSLVSSAREKIDGLKSDLEVDAEAKAELDKVMEVITRIARENENLKNKIIKMYEKWGDMVSAPIKNS